jgi:ABC-2 type transport system permease protein
VTRTWATLRLIIGREVRAWRKPFVISTAAIFVLVGAGLSAVVVFGGADDTVVHRVGLVGETPAGFAADVEQLLPDDESIEVVGFDSEADGERAVRDVEVDVVVVGNSLVLTGPGTSGSLADAVGQTLVLAQAGDRAAELGLSPADVIALLTPDLEFREASGEPDDGDETDEVVSIVATIILFMAILAYGQWIGYAVVEEKANRVVELLLGAVRPHHLMGAKVVSIGALGLSQVAVIGVMVVGFGLASERFGVPSVRLSTVAWVLVWFLLGYAFYGTLYAAAGSLASNNQEAGSALGPLSLLLVVGYMAGMISFGEGVGDNTVLRVMSFLPLWSPLTMPGRTVRGWAQPWEVTASLLIMGAAIYGMIRLAGWIYAGGVARATAKLGWGEALRAGRDLRSARR